MRIALRTQQIIAHETGVTNTIDPLGGAYFVEALTDEMERQAYEYFAKIDELGGMVEAVKANYPQREIADAAFRLQAEYDARERILVGVNDFTEGGDGVIETLRIDPALERRQIDGVRRVRAERDGAAARAAPSRPCAAAAARDDENLMPHLIDCARVLATEGEIVERPAVRVRHLHRDPRLLEESRVRKLIVPVLAVAGLGLSAAPASSAGTIVRLKDNVFSPKSRTLARNSTVTFRWAGKNAHNIVVTKGPAKFSAPAQVKGSFRQSSHPRRPLHARVHPPRRDAAQAARALSVGRRGAPRRESSATESSRAPRAGRPRRAARPGRVAREA